MIFVVGTKRVLGTDTVKYYKLPEHLIKYKRGNNKMIRLVERSLQRSNIRYQCLDDE